MSKIKTLLEDTEDFVDFIDDDYWCHYAGMPSPTAYDNTEGNDIG
jgi:hypothetical protein